MGRWITWIARIAWVAAGLHADVVDFDFTGRSSALGWTAAHDVVFQTSADAGLGIAVQAADPFVVSPAFDAPATGLLMVEVRMRSEVGGPAQLFWFNEAAGEADSIHFACRTNAWTDVCVAIPAMGRGTRLRIDPPGSGGHATLAWVRVSTEAGRGIREAVVRDDTLLLHVSGPPASFHVVEVPPHGSLSGLTPDHAMASPGAGASPVAVPRMTSSGADARDRVLSGFVLLERHPVHGWRPCGPVRHVGDLEGISPPGVPPPRPASKKGLQVQMVEDAIALGVRHAALNVDLPSLMDAGGGPDAYEWRVAGKVHRFRRAAVDAIPVKALSDSGASVTLILLAYASGQPARDAIWLHPGYDGRAPNRLGAFNHGTEEGARWLQAAVELLCHRFSRPGFPHGRVSGLIVGNEVTAHWHWANMGEVPASLFIEDYAGTLRLVHAAAARVAPFIRVYGSWDHHWTLTHGEAPLRAIPGRRLLDELARVARLGGDFPWHVAYHPYPEDLFQPATWRDKTALPAPGTPRITFRNLDVLTSYLGREALLWKGRPRRVVLSEQGFHSDGTPEGEQQQAAAYAYAWHKADALEGIDAFILHRHVDHRDEGGLNLGLWRRRAGSVADPDVPKPIREVFLRADTAERDGAFAFALPRIGVTNWAQVRASSVRGTP